MESEKNNVPDNEFIDVKDQNKDTRNTSREKNRKCFTRTKLVLIIAIISA